MDKNLKKIVYIAAAMFLFLLLAFIAYAETEIWYIRKMLAAGITPVRYGLDFLPPLVLPVFVVVGLAFGYVAGQRWWRFVYVEKRHWSYHRKSKIDLVIKP